METRPQGALPSICHKTKRKWSDVHEAILDYQDELSEKTVNHLRIYIAIH